MKQIKKYILVTILLFIGLFVINVDVYADDDCNVLVCEYNTDIGSIVLNCDNTNSRLACYIDKTKSTATKFTLDGLYGKIKVISSNVCPKFYVYEKRLTIGGVDHTLISEDTNVQDLTFALTHEPRNLIDYATPEPNSCTPESEKLQCTADQIKEIKKALNSKYYTINSLYRNYQINLENQSITDSSISNESDAHQKCEPLATNAENYANKLKDDFASLNLHTIVESKLLEFNCSSSEDFLSGYGIENLTKSLTDLGEKNYQYCLASTNISKEEEDNLMNDMQQHLDEVNNQISAEVDNIIELSKNHITSIFSNSSVELSCNGILGYELIDLIEQIYGYIKIAAPIILIVLGIVDFGQAVLVDDNDALRKATSKFIRRAIVCVVIFFVPLILNLLLNLADSAGLNLLDDPLCGIK